MSGFNYCLAQIAEYEIQSGKNKKILDCEDCPIKDTCKQYAKTQRAFETIVKGKSPIGE